mmetsp:Transcript_2546/g.8369  ORF Transcript_2546/g.8369 Transcript_2546/m.8369 type:complete len:134 (-) Transcript_2546:63-464(-)
MGTSDDTRHACRPLRHKFRLCGLNRTTWKQGQKIEGQHRRCKQRRERETGESRWQHSLQEPPLSSPDSKLSSIVFASANMNLISYMVPGFLSFQTCFGQELATLFRNQRKEPLLAPQVPCLLLKSNGSGAGLP